MKPSTHGPEMYRLSHKFQTFTYLELVLRNLPALHFDFLAHLYTVLVKAGLGDLVVEHVGFVELRLRFQPRDVGHVHHELVISPKRVIKA